MEKTTPTETPCKGCGKPIQWCRNAMKFCTVGSIPVDARVPVYRIVRRDGKKFAELQTPTEEWGTNHFATCSEANQFAKKAEDDRVRRRKLALQAKAALLRILGHPSATLADAVSVTLGEGEQPDEFGARVRQQIAWVVDRLHDLQTDLAPETR